MPAYAVIYKGKLYGVYDDIDNAERLEGKVVEITLPHSWHNCLLQMARIISELEAVGAFTPEIVNILKDSMDLEISDINEIVESAHCLYDEIKASIKPSIK
jgi:hypothetical protein